MSYEVLDNIADSYIPIALGIAIVSFFLPSKRPHLPPITVNTHGGDKPFVAARVLILILLLSVAYGVMFVDKALGIWLYFGSDYSTHTAVYVCLSMYLCLVLAAYRFLWIVVCVSYLALMYYQAYHSIRDIATSLLTVASIGSAVIYGFSVFCHQAFGDIPVFFRKIRANAESSS